MPDTPLVSKAIEPNFIKLFWVARGWHELVKLG
jgi:hypothetical protein